MMGRKVIYLRCIKCSYNNVAKGIRVLDKKAIFGFQEKFHASKSFRKTYPLKATCGCPKGICGLGGKASKNKLKDTSFIFLMTNVTILGVYRSHAQKEYSKV